MLNFHFKFRFFLRSESNWQQIEEEEEDFVLNEEEEEEMAVSGPDPLFGLRNNFYIGAYQAAINNSDVPNLSQEDAVERDTLVYRSYIALSSYQVFSSFFQYCYDFEFFCDC